MASIKKKTGHKEVHDALLLQGKCVSSIPSQQAVMKICTSPLINVPLTALILRQRSGETGEKCF